MSEVALPVNLPVSSSAAANTPGANILVIDDEAAIGSRSNCCSRSRLPGAFGRDARRGAADPGLGQLRPGAAGPGAPGQSGLELLPLIKNRQPDLPVIMITAYGTVENVVDAIRAGAENFVQKPWDNEKLLADIRSAGSAPSRGKRRTCSSSGLSSSGYNFANIVGKSEIMLKVFDLVAQIAPSRSTVLIQGESGTGKELIAKAIHANSPRKDKPFVPINTGRCVGAA